MAFQSSLVIRYSAYVWNGVCGTSLLHLDDPDRLRATAQLCGTGNRWRPLPDALALLWQASAWREELHQLLHLLAERADRRLHPLPWALPIPLRVHGRYSRAEIEAEEAGVKSVEQFTFNRITCCSSAASAPRAWCKGSDRSAPV